jgi:hypothetical protein
VLAWAAQRDSVVEEAARAMRRALEDACGRVELRNFQEYVNKVMGVQMSLFVESSL